MWQEKLYVSGAANSRRSPLLAFLRFQRAGRDNRFSSPSGLFRPENAPEFLPSGFLSFQRSEAVSSLDPPLPFMEQIALRLFALCGFEGLAPLEIGVRPSPD
jgi:hypothetical protein